MHPVAIFMHHGLELQLHFPRVHHKLKLVQVCCHSNKKRKLSELAKVAQVEHELLGGVLVLSAIANHHEPLPFEISIQDHEPDWFVDSLRLIVLNDFKLREEFQLSIRNELGLLQGVLEYKR